MVNVWLAPLAGGHGDGKADPAPVLAIGRRTGADNSQTPIVQIFEKHDANWHRIWAKSAAVHQRALQTCLLVSCDAASSRGRTRRTCDSCYEWLLAHGHPGIVAQQWVAADAQSQCKRHRGDVGGESHRHRHAFILRTAAGRLHGRIASSGGNRDIARRQAPRCSTSTSMIAWGPTTGRRGKAAPGNAVPMPTPAPSQQTLSPADLAPAWRGPHPRRTGRLKIGPGSKCRGCMPAKRPRQARPRRVRPDRYFSLATTSLYHLAYISGMPTP